jgi:hypothetical protein
MPEVVEKEPYAGLDHHAPWLLCRADGFVLMRYGNSASADAGLQLNPEASFVRDARDRDREGVLLTRAELSEWAGRKLSDEQLHRLASAIAHSSITGEWA